jgi:hypothetical protein
LVGPTDVHRGRGPGELRIRIGVAAKMIDDEDSDVDCRWPVPEESVEK